MDPFELSESLKVEAPLSRVIPLYPATLTHFVRRCRINRRYDSQESLLVISLQRSALSLKDGSCLHPGSATFLHLPTRDILYPSFEFASFARILPPLPPFPPSSNVKRSFDGTKLIIRAKGRKEKRRRDRVSIDDEDPSWRRRDSRYFSLFFVSSAGVKPILSDESVTGRNTRQILEPSREDVAFGKVFRLKGVEN